MRAGRLRHTITLKSPAETLGSHNEVVQTWIDAATDIPAAVEPIRGREYLAAQRETVENMYRVTLRYLAGISSSWRVHTEDGQILEIKSIIDVGGRKRTIELMCSEFL